MEAIGAFGHKIISEETLDQIERGQSTAWVGPDSTSLIYNPGDTAGTVQPVDLEIL